MAKIDIRRVKGHNIDWELCGQADDYGLFKNIKPRALAIKLIQQVFTEEEIAERRFFYIPTVYRGHNSMEDEIVVFCKKKTTYTVKDVGLSYDKGTHKFD